MRPFQISVSDQVLEDLRERLSRSRLLPDSPRRPESGMSSEYLSELVSSWRDFDSRSREARLNEHPQFIADVQGTGIHFAHLLPDFHIVVPSFPG